MGDIHAAAKPFFIKGNSPQSLLFLHGFTASPSEVWPVARKLNEINNCSISGILLPGHGTTPEQLNEICWPEWYRAVHDELISLLNNYQQVFVGGLSLGALLALHAAVNINGLTGVAAINAPIFYHNAIIPRLADLARLFTPYYHKKGLKEIIEFENQGRFAYRVMPLKAFHSLNQLRRIVMQEVAGLEIPALIIQSQRDESVHFRSGNFLYEKISQENAQLIILNKSGHVATMGSEKELIAHKMASFMAMNFGTGK